MFYPIRVLVVLWWEKCKNDEKRFREPKMAARMKLLKEKKSMFMERGKHFYVIEAIFSKAEQSSKMIALQ